MQIKIYDPIVKQWVNVLNTKTLDGYSVSQIIDMAVSAVSNKYEERIQRLENIILERG